MNLHERSASAVESREASSEVANVSRWIRQLRARTGLTQEKFAARLGMTFPTINRWENGHSRPSPLALMQIQSLAEELAREQARAVGPVNATGQTA